MCGEEGGGGRIPWVCILDPSPCPRDAGCEQAQARAQPAKQQCQPPGRAGLLSPNQTRKPLQPLCFSRISNHSLYYEILTLTEKISQGWAPPLPIPSVAVLPAGSSCRAVISRRNRYTILILMLQTASLWNPEFKADPETTKFLFRVRDVRGGSGFRLCKQSQRAGWARS